MRKIPPGYGRGPLGSWTVAEREKGRARQGWRGPPDRGDRGTAIVRDGYMPEMLTTSSLSRSRLRPPPQRPLRQRLLDVGCRQHRARFVPSRRSLQNLPPRLLQRRRLLSSPPRRSRRSRRRLRASAASSATNRLSAEPTRAAPASFIARPRGMVSSAIPLAKASRWCSSPAIVGASSPGGRGSSAPPRCPTGIVWWGTRGGATSENSVQEKFTRKPHSHGQTGQALVIGNEPARKEWCACSLNTHSGLQAQRTGGEHERGPRR
jgi:hypothetical protein